MTNERHVQLEIFSPRAKQLARSTDPETSHMAAKAVARQGIASRQRRSVLGAVLRWPSRTTAELATLLQVDRSVPGRRMCELERAGFVINDGRRACRIKGSTARTYLITEQGQRELGA